VLQTKGKSMLDDLGSCSKN